jgi:nucleotide-binding universal stress UspA family protein
MSASDDVKQPKIVVGVDGSRPSVEALRWAVRQAELTGGSISAVIAWQYPITAGGLGWGVASGFDDVDYADLSGKALKAVIDEVSPPESVTVHQLVIDGNPAQVLLDTAADADLLVVGNRGHGAFADALLGSVSERCARHARCPVLVMHGAASDRPAG